MVTLVQVPRYVALLKNYGSKPTLTNWLKKDGDPVEEGQTLVVIETTKTSLEIQAMASGLVFIMRKAGEKVKIGDTLAVIAKNKVELKEFKAQLVGYNLN
jgi:pyruvate/2-oxoglutarate dehydrogenase complex dihydrolipoamide acyltransferase (E2) component